MTEIYLIRHGEAEGNVFRRLHGQYNSLLMPRGHIQAQCIEKRFASVRIDACYSSDLTRAGLTARSIYLSKGLPLHRDPRFRELDVGSWEDMTYGYLDNFEAEQMWKFSHDPVNWNVPGAETYDIYTQRFIEAMTEAAEDHDGGTIAIFSHGAVLRSTLMRLFFHGDAEKLPLSDNAGVSRLFYSKGKFTYDYLNDNSHIPPELSTFYIQSWWRKTDNRKEANLYFLPYSSEMSIPKEVAMPQLDSDGLLMAAFLRDRPIGLLSLGKEEGTTGKVLGMSLMPQLTGRYYADQFLGCAVSHFRKKGCKDLQLLPGDYPDDVVSRYAFDPQTWQRSFDAEAFTWTTP